MVLANDILLARGKLPRSSPPRPHQRRGSKPCGRCSVSLSLPVSECLAAVGAHAPEQPVLGCPQPAGQLLSAAYRTKADIACRTRIKLSPSVINAGTGSNWRAGPTSPIWDRLRVSRCLQASSVGGFSPLYASGPRGAWRPVHLPPSCVAVLLAPSTAIGTNSLSQYDFGLVSLLQVVRSGVGVILTSPSGPLGVGVRSGSRKRNAATASFLAGGGAGPESLRTAAYRRTWRYAVSMRGMSGSRSGLGRYLPYGGFAETLRPPRAYPAAFWR